IKEQYGPFGFPTPRDAGRPYVSSNFVMGLDGRASFRELPGQAGGREVSRSKEDRWLMDFIRAHHDAQIMGASTLREELGRDRKVVSVGEGSIVDIPAAMRALRQEHGIRTLLCEGGPTLYGEMLNRQLIDEDFRTLSLQVLGKTTKPPIERPTTYGHLSYVPENAPWFRLVSLHYALPYHAFLRVRYEGPRRFEA